MGYVKQPKISIVKSDQGMGGKLMDVIYIIMKDDVANKSIRCEDQAIEQGAIVLNSGAIMESIQVVPGSLKLLSNTVGNSAENTASMENSIECVHPGDLIPIKNFVQNRINLPMIVVLKECRTGRMTIYGDYCTPIYMSAKIEHDKTKNTTTMNFKTEQGALVVADFTGTLPPAVVTYLDVDTTSLPLGLGLDTYYTNPANTTAHVIGGFTFGLEDLTGTIFSIVGGGGAFPQTISNNGSILLDRKVDWVGHQGCFITFKVFKYGTTYQIVEQTRG